MRKLALALLLNISLLFSPAPKPADIVCGRYVHITRSAGFTLNRDTYGFIRPAIWPRMLFDQRSPRQSRPLFILAGSAAGYVCYYTTLPFQQQLYRLYSSFSRGIFPDHLIYPLGTFYISFVLLNILLVWLSLYLFEKIYLLLQGKSRYGMYVMYAVMVVIASNRVTKGFIWTVHQQMFALFTPLLCIYLLLRFIKKESLVPYKYNAALALGGGLLLLVYGNFLLLLPVLLFGFTRNYRQYASPGGWKKLIGRNVLLVLLFLLPTLGWIGLLKLNGISYYSQELVSYRQLVWIKDLLSISPVAFFTVLGKYSAAFIGSMKDVWIVLAGAVTLLVLARASWKMDRKVTAILFILGLFVTFYWLLGFYAERLTFTLAPVICCLLVALGKQALYKKQVLYPLIVFALSWHLYMLLRPGPYC
jgi:hypothetical protein